MVYFKLGLLKIIRLIILILILFFAIESNIFSNQLINDINEATVFTINEYISDEYGINLAAKVKSQVLIRAWFKWMRDTDYKKDAWVIEEAHKQSALFGGGVTCSSIDKGIFPEEEFLDLITREPEGNLYHAYGLQNINTYHGSLENKKWLDYVLLSAYKQIDAGIDLIFLDEVHGAYNQFEGYDDYGIKAFREFLIKKYCKGKKWKIDDKRWIDLFKILLDNKDICPDGTIKTFNYCAYLRYYSWTKDPNNINNPLSSLWKEYGEERNEKAWRYWIDKIHAYAKKKHKKIFICENSVGKEGADFQMVAFMGPFLNCSFDMTFFFNSRINSYREKLKKDIPIVFFHDWGFGGMPWHQLTTKEKINWLKIYVPEVYALGAFFAFPVHGRWGFGNAEENGTLPTIIKLADFFNENSSIYHNIKELNPYKVKLNKKNIRRTFYEKVKSNQKIIHLINHNFVNGEFIIQNDLIITLKLESPKEIYAVSPDFEGKKEVKFFIEDDKIKIYVPSFETYCVVVLVFGALDSGFKNVEGNSKLAKPPIGLDSLLNINSLPVLRDSRSFMISSADPTGGNIDWLPHYIESGVIANLEGPGCIYRIWIGGGYGATFKLYFDGSEKPGVTLRFVGDAGKPICETGELPLTSGGDRIKVSYPLMKRTGKDIETGISYMPMPFSKSCKITIEPKVVRKYHQINYHIYPKGVKLETFNLSKLSKSDWQKIEKIVNMWSVGGKDTYRELINQTHTPASQVKSAKISLRAAETTILMYEKGRGNITSIRFKLPDRLRVPKILQGLFIKIHWDDEREASVKSPLGPFFGDAWGRPADYKNFLMGYAEGWYYCYFPMPFNKMATVELENNTGIDISEIYYEIKYQRLNRIANNLARFHAVFLEETDARLAKPINFGEDNYVILYAEGLGHYIGCNVFYDADKNRVNYWPGEGDEMIYVDEEPAQFQFGTGTEDYCNLNYGFHDVIYPFSGVTYAGGTPDCDFSAWKDSSNFPHRGYSFYRFHISDCIPFKRNIWVTLEHYCPGNYASVAYWYQKEPHISISGTLRLKENLIRAAEDQLKKFKK